MRYLGYSIVFLLAALTIVLIPTKTDPDVQYADLPRFETMTVQNVQLLCVDNGRCFDVKKLPARYRAAAEERGLSL